MFNYAFGAKDDHGDNFELLISYEINIPTIKEEEQMKRFMAVDLGVVNLATMAPKEQILIAYGLG